MNWKLWGGVALVAVIALVLFGAKQSTAPEPLGESPEAGMPVPGTDTPETVVSPSPSPVSAGPVSTDSVVNAILGDAAADQTLIAAEEANADLAIQDASDLNDLGAAYSGNEF
jgi:hypothetical protein